MLRDFFQRELGKKKPVDVSDSESDVSSKGSRRSLRLASLSSASSRSSVLSDASSQASPNTPDLIASPVVTPKRKEEEKSKLIGQGASGCVYHPGLKCKPGSKQSDEINKEFGENPNYIMKVSSSKALAAESRNALSVVTIPHSERYFTTIIAPPCQVEVVPSLEQKCTTYRQADKKEKETFEGAFMRYRGPSVGDAWYKLPNDVRNIETLFFFGQHLCTGLALLHKANITHFDIKPDNLLLAANKDLMSPVTFIDFGLSMVWPSITASAETKWDSVMHLLGYSGQYYTPYPPEFFMCIIKEDTGQVGRLHADKLQKDYAAWEKKNPSLWNPLRETWGPKAADQIAGLNEISDKIWWPEWQKLFGRKTLGRWLSETVPAKDIEAQYYQIRDYFKKFDVFSLGVAIYDMFYDLDKPTSETQAQYDQCMQVIREMCEMNPTRRLSADFFANRFQELRSY